MESPNNIASILLAAKNIVILPHIMADGDTLGSSVALYLALKEIGKKPCILMDEEIPSNLGFFIPKHYVQQYLEDDFKPDLVVAIDCSDLERVGMRKEYLVNTLNTLNIDHHKTNSLFAKCNFVDHEAAATGEVIYSIIKSLKISLTKEIATALYVAISTDTGSFKYDNTTFETHLIASELLLCGVNLNQATTELYQRKPIYKMKLMAEALNTLEFHYNGKLGLLTVTNKMLQKVGANSTDADGLIEIVRDLDGVEVGILLKEINEEEVKIGFRAKYDVDVSEIAKKFGGGGHTKASGCTIFDKIQNAKESIISVMSDRFR